MEYGDLGLLVRPQEGGRPPSVHPPVHLPRQHADRPHLLASALLAAKGTAPDLAGLAEFVLPRMPRTPLASSTLKTGEASSGETLLDDAVKSTWWSYNCSDWTVAVTIDCDHAHAEDSVETFMWYLRQVDPEAPVPMIVRDPYSARAHVTWILELDVYTGPQTEAGAVRSGPVLRTLAAVQRGLCKVLDGDPNFTNRLSKNPFAVGVVQPKRDWTTDPATGRKAFLAPPPAEPGLWERHVASGTKLRNHTIPGDCRRISLLTLWRALKVWREDSGESIPGPRRRRQHDAADVEKGARLFHASRFPVYDLGTSDLTTIRAVVDEQAQRIGSPAGPSQREHIARSIARFMRSKYTGTGSQHVRRGVLGLDAASLDLAERQALGGKYGATQNAADTDRRIADAESRLQAKGKKLTAVAVAAEAGVSERTVRDRRQKPEKQCASGKAALVAARPGSLSPAGEPLAPASMDPNEKPCLLMMQGSGAAHEADLRSLPQAPRGEREGGSGGEGRGETNKLGMLRTEVVEDPIWRTVHRIGQVSAPTTPARPDDRAIAEALAADETDPVLRRQMVRDYMASRRIIKAERARHQMRIARIDSTRFV